MTDLTAIRNHIKDLDGRSEQTCHEKVTRFVQDHQHAEDKEKGQNADEHEVS